MRKIILLFLTIVITGALPAQTNSIFQPSDGPVLPISTGPPVELGVKFKATQGGSITGIQYYKGSSSTGIHIGNLWTSTGTLLASAVFTSETATGWQKVFFTTPVPITAGVTYVASYFSPSGEYSYSSPFFTSAVVNGPLRALANGEDGPNGVYNFTATSAFPANGFNKSNYWVDVIFAPSPGPDMDPPVILSTAPSNAATGVSTTAVVTVTFNEPIDPATINNNTFELRNPSNTLVPAVVSYNAATYTATLAPAAALLNATLYSVVIKGGTTGPRVKDAAGNALAANQNWSFTTIPVYTPNSIFQPTDGPVLPVTHGGSPVELGVKFKTTQAGFITGLQYYKSTGATGTHTGTLWTSTGTLLASATFTGETASGWQKVFFTIPVPVTTGITYVASYFSPSGDYSYSSPFFSSAVVNGPLKALADGEDGPNGLYNFSAVSAFPFNGFNSSNYWVDVVYTANLGTDMTPPVVLSTTPVDAAPSASISAPITIVFNEPIDPATINNTTFELRDPSNTLVPATVTYNAATYTVTLAPAAALLNTTLYSAVIKGGTTGTRVKDAAGNALAANYNWSFTTVPQYAQSYIFQATDAPALPVTHGGSSVELGVKFKASQPGFITGIQYYKSSGTTGIHTGHLWTSTGTLLASATFTGETASGWQKAYFAAPILITNGITYVASYFSASGDYSFTYPYFTSAVVNGPLRALADGEEGANGVYTFAATSSFPVNGFNSSNYWVDVVYTKSPDNIGRIFPQPDSSAGQLTVSVFPNPVSSYSWFNLKMKGNNSKPVTIKVFDVSGRVVQVVEKPVPAGLLKIGQTWSAGIYFAEVTQGNQRKVVKMIKMN